jgi:dTDP-4-dehydrorhamnose reductase
LKDNLDKPKIVVTGANGQLGHELVVASFIYPQFEFVFLSRDELPIDDPAKVMEFFSAARAAYCINCAAYTAVDKAESEKETAFRINADAVLKLGLATKQSKTRLIHLSTDYVFDGNSSTPLKEDDPTSPINIYGESKLKGEENAIRSNEDTIIIRTSWVYSSFGKNFVKTMIRLMAEKGSVNVINDQYGSPTYAADLASVIVEIIRSDNFIPGVYNYSNEGEISWFDFALAIKEFTNSSCLVNPIPTAQYPTPAKRPHYSLLDKSKIKQVYHIEIPDWKTSLKACIDRFVQ